MTALVMNCNNLKVHREDCPYIRRELRDKYNSFTEYDPKGPEVSKWDEACRRCLPDGIPT